MEYALNLAHASLATDCAIVGVLEAQALSGAAAQLDTLAQGQLRAVLASGDFSGKLNQTLLLHTPQLPCKRVILVGCGKEADLTLNHWLKAFQHGVHAAQATQAREAVCHLTQFKPRDATSHQMVLQAVAHLESSHYQFHLLKSRKDNPKPLRKLSFAFQEQAVDYARMHEALHLGEALAAGMNLTRDLGNLPPNLCTPTYLAQVATQLAGTHHRFHLEVLERAEIEALKMGAFLAVTKGSHEPPKFIVLKYLGAAEAARPIVLVGKGITFDSGGISIKPAEAMDEMKYDMSGAGSVLGVLKACSLLNLPLNIIGIIPTCENLPGGNASRPGDIVTSMSGQTIEILNTDAEGRMILADALTYSARFNPDCVIDLATLTGACIIALGYQASALLTNHQPLADELLRASEQVQDRAWQLPMWEEYQEQLKSNFADMANVGGRPAGTITGACFLARYVRQQHWVHLDIAGTAWRTGKDKGATGRPVPLLLQFLYNRAHGE